MRLNVKNNILDSPLHYTPLLQIFLKRHVEVVETGMDGPIGPIILICSRTKHEFRVIQCFLRQVQRLVQIVPPPSFVLRVDIVSMIDTYLQ